MQEPRLLISLNLRLLVGFLGERAQCAWWPTAFHEASARLFLDPVFSKTSRLAQYHGVLEAARRVHDEHLNVGSYHLFRLPEEVEQDLYASVQRGLGAELAGQSLRSKEAALEALRRLAVPGGAGDAGSLGPTAVGRIEDLDSAATLQAIAAAYLSAFTQNARTYPYLLP